jgi:pyruvate carboxylase
MKNKNVFPNQPEQPTFVEKGIDYLINNADKYVMAMGVAVGSLALVASIHGLKTNPEKFWGIPRKTTVESVVKAPEGFLDRPVDVEAFATKTGEFTYSKTEFDPVRAQFAKLIYGSMNSPIYSFKSVEHKGGEYSLHDSQGQNIGLKMQYRNEAQEYAGKIEVTGRLVDVNPKPEVQEYVLEASRVEPVPQVTQMQR